MMAMEKKSGTKDMEELKTEIIKQDHPDYPKSLFNIKRPPKRLFVRGDIKKVEDDFLLGVVGSRKETTYGRAVAERIGEKCADYGVTLVSGMARGIDGSSMRGALRHGGNVVGVLGNGVDICYPESNRKIYKETIEHGVMISEYPDGQKARRHTFPERNRIISGLCDALVVVEAGVRSGSLITAELAADQGKPVFAVPGNITSPVSLGTNLLIADGAKSIQVIDDIFRFSEIDVTKEKNHYENLGKDEAKILRIVENNGETTVENIYRETNISPAEINGIVTVLEMKGLVFCEIGKICIAKIP